MLGEEQEFLEHFDWTDDSLRDLQSVNIQGTHTLCRDRYQVLKYTNKQK